MLKKFSFLIFILFVALIFSCGGEEGGDMDSANSRGADDVARNPEKQEEITKRNLEIEQSQTSKRRPCDTLSLKAYVFDNYPKGTYLIELNQTYTFAAKSYAVIYQKDKGKQYIYALIAKSKQTERAIETKNIVGYASSFVNLDSTRLGTAFFYLTLFECNKDGNFTLLWEYEVPQHGGFNSMKLLKWKDKKIPYIQLNYVDAINSGFRDYNYFMVNGIRNRPHLLETYEAIARKRIMANINNDDYPDFWEFRYVDSVMYVRQIDSIPFYWDTTKTLYVTKRTSKWWRKY